MSKLFSYDGPVVAAIEGFAHLVALNLITMALCIPIVTGGAALTALHYSVLHLVRGEEGHIYRDYFREFKANFKWATLLWLPMLLMGAFIIFDIWLIRTNPDAFPAALRVVFGAGFIIISMALVWIFPLLCHFAYNSVGTYIHNAILISIGNLPRTIAMLIISILPLLAIYRAPYKSLAWLFILGISGPAWLKAWLYSSAFKKYEPKEDSSEEADGEEVGGASEGFKTGASGPRGE